MKTLTQFIKEYDPEYNIQYYIMNENLHCPSDILSEFTFEEFCKFNKVVPTEDIWYAYMNYWNGVPSDFSNKAYNYRQFLNESEVIVGTNEEIINDIYKKFEINKDKFKLRLSASKLYKPIEIYDKSIIDSEEKTKKLINILNFWNWSGYEDNKYILLKPNKTETITNKVYNYPYIYHYCPKFIYDEKIKKYGLNPKHKPGSKYEKLFCFYSKNPESSMLSFIRLKNRLIDNKYKKDKINNEFIILKIDLSKNKNKIAFYTDEESNSENAFYTFEPIPPFCIEVLKEIKI
ncbi:MAG: hypothetical protein J1F35_08590 [Erysipelotrichales bacterium]|nr:hypothetical protein [Erysipelotrichales bacterium]